jgi:hypothetical protein
MSSSYVPVVYRGHEKRTDNVEESEIESWSNTGNKQLKHYAPE